MPTSAKVLECSVPPCAHLVFVDLNLCAMCTRKLILVAVFLCVQLSDNRLHPD